MDLNNHNNNMAGREVHPRGALPGSRRAGGASLTCILNSRMSLLSKPEVSNLKKLHEMFLQALQIQRWPPTGSERLLEPRGAAGACVAFPSRAFEQGSPAGSPGVDTGRFEICAQERIISCHIISYCIILYDIIVLYYVILGYAGT